MSGNRVEELEAKVRKLEATIEGLTDELVETKERLGAVEDETGIEPDVLKGRRAKRDRSEQMESTADTDGTDGETTEESDDEETADSELGDDIIVA